MENNNILGIRIRLLREKNNLKQKELAKILNIANTTLSQYENGRRIPSDEVKVKICKHFNVSLDYLLGRTENLNSLNLQKTNKENNCSRDEFKNLTQEEIETLAVLAKTLKEQREKKETESNEN